MLSTLGLASELPWSLCNHLHPLCTSIKDYTRSRTRKNQAPFVLCYRHCGSYMPCPSHHLRSSLWYSDKRLVKRAPETARESQSKHDSTRRSPEHYAGALGGKKKGVCARTIETEVPTAELVWVADTVWQNLAQVH